MQKRFGEEAIFKMRDTNFDRLSAVQKQKDIIDSFPEPENDYDRVDFNAEALERYFGKTYKKHVIDIVATISIPFFILLYCINLLLCFRKKKNIGKTIIIESCNRKGKLYDFEGRIPEFDKDYDPIYEFKPGKFPKFTEGIMGKKAIKIFWTFFCRHPLKGFENLRCLVNLMGYNRLLFLYEPSAIVNSRVEINQMSSLNSLLCESNNCEFICFMHGEVMVNIFAAFIRFSKFYIWDKHYIDVFNWSRCGTQKYYVYHPDLYKVDSAIQSKSRPKYYLTYYLTGNEKTGVDEHASDVASVLHEITVKGYECKVRPHPRWSDFEQLNNIFKDTGVDLENCSEVSVQESILDSEMVAGTFSTVLTQAYYYGKKVYIDDITDKGLIEELREKKYFLFSKKAGFLSDLLRDIEQGE